jgi:parvulin-like peptidyl-prolyl isomerase
VKLQITNYKLQAPVVVVLVLIALCAASAQVASHAPTQTNLAVDKPVVRVNNVVLTERDLLREMYAIFPYAQQHSGFPKSMEAEIRKGALQMVIFEELVYQEAVRRKMVISADRMKRAEADFRKQFSSQQEFDQYMQAELGGSRQLLRQRIRRSLLIEALLKMDVTDKAKVSVAQARDYYLKNPAQFKYPETFTIQTISMIPPQNAGAEVAKEARQRAEDAARKAKATKSYREFGLLAEKVSDDDWHVNMGDRKAVDRAALPPPVVKAAIAMKPGQVSDLIQLGDRYTLFRLNAHTPAGKKGFEEVKDKLRSDMEKSRYNELRTQLNKKLSQNAKVQEL